MNASYSVKLINPHKFMLVSMLPICLGLLPLQAEAVSAVGGNSTTANVVVNSAAAWTTLRTMFFNNPANTTRYCVATGSSDGLNPGVFGAHRYRFTLSLDNLAPPLNTGFERTLEFLNQAVGGVQLPDNRIKEITSTGGVFVTGGGFHAIRWQARKAGGAANMTVTDSSLSVVCTDSQLFGLIIPPIPPVITTPIKPIEP